MDKLSFLTLLVVIAAGLVSADTYTFKIGYYMNETNFAGDGYVHGTLSYHFDTAKRSNSIVRYDHSVAGIGGASTVITEFENFTSQTTFKICPGMCEGASFSNLAERWWYNKSSDTLDESDTFKGDDGLLYYRYNRKMIRQAGVKALYLLKSAAANDVVIPTGPEQLPARIIFQSGRQVFFKKSTFQTIQRSNPSFTMPTGVTCPIKKCRSYLDIVFVLDESGSINNQEFSTMKTFARALVGNLTVGLDAAAISVVMFSSNSRIAFDLSYVNVDGLIQNIAQKGGTTYQGKCLANAYSILNKTNWRREHYGRPTPFVIALTDGADFDYTSINASAKKLKEWGVFLIEVGVGISTTYANKLRAVASSLNGEPGYFDVKNFNALLTKINDLVTPICENSNATSCDPKCSGYCGCSMSCYCPTCTDLGSKCVKNTCEVFGNTTNGCEVTNTTDHFDKCLDYTCDEQNGWTTTVHKCDPNMKSCEQQDCVDDEIGCRESLKMDNLCTDLPDLCHVGKCAPKSAGADPTTGCVYETTCTGESDSNIVYPDGNRGCIDYVCMDGTCVEQDTCQKEGRIDDCMAMQCNRKTNKCEIAGENETTCTVATDCPVKDSCTKRVCSDGKCTYTPKDGSPLPTCNGCYKARCNEETGKYELYYRGCGNKDMCVNEFCVNGTGNCTYEAKYPYKPCFDVDCDKDTGKGAGYVPRNCSNPDIEKGTCIRFSCNEKTDRCESYIADADEACPNDNPLCVKVNCSEHGARCQYRDVVAPGVTKCKLSRCDPKTGIAELYDKCDDGRICTTDTCDRDGNCSNRYHYCEYMPKDNLSSCFFWGCSENRKNGCYQKIYDNAYFDECGYCIGPYDDENEPDKKKLRECKKDLTWEEKAAAISGGVAGAIVVACVVAALGVSVGGTLLTRELIKRARAAADSGAVENPMYQDNGREMSNPAFEGEDMDG